uniref:Uncharacterized protein n=1 Tax=Anopheles atroparvus TaxID=41427 RepID=A0AAG5DPG9_ANOAO
SSLPVRVDYSIHGVTVERTPCIRDLFVLLDHRLTFKDYQDYVISKGNQLLGLLRKATVDFTDPVTIKAVFCRIIRPVLEYCYVVWCPSTVTAINRLKSIQWRLTRYAIRLLPWPDRSQMPPYRSRCLLLGLEPLSVTLAQCLFVAGMFSGAINSPVLLANIGIYAPRVLRSGPLLHAARRRTSSGLPDPMLPMCEVFNCYSDVFDFNVSLPVFKEALRLSIVH